MTTTPAFAFAPVGAILIAVFLNTALIAPSMAATDVAFTDFRGAWAAGATYSAGTVVTYNGVSYIALKENSKLIPAGHPGNWAPLGPANVFGANSVTYTTGTAGATCNFGSLLLTAAKVIPAGYVAADGSLLMISENSTLFSLLGNTFGGDGVTNFALPDLAAAAPNDTKYLICVSGIYP
jgi:hypothetical protein